MKKKRRLLAVIFACILVPAFVRFANSPGWAAMRAVDIVTLVGIGFVAGMIAGTFVRGSVPTENA